MLDALRLTPARAFELCTACWRGYVARWELRDERLYLLAVDHWRGDGVRVDFAAEFPPYRKKLPKVECLFTDLDRFIRGPGRLRLSAFRLGAVSEWLEGRRSAPLRASWVCGPVGLCAALATDGYHGNG